MPSFQQHCEESVRLFGKEFPDVHLWLDEFAGTKEYGFRHRHKRHHLAGIAEAVRRFGPEVEAATRQHILSDLKMEGWTESDPFPRDEQHYRKMGLF